MNSFLLISGAGFLAGTMNALAGGGSFVTLPALIAAGVPSVQANASSTVALLPGAAVSSWAYRDGLGPVGAASLRSLLIVTLLGSIVGALLLLWTPSKIFDFVLPWLLLIATLALTFGRRIGEWLRRRWRIGQGVVLAIQFVLGIYSGYYGGAVGIMMMAVWGLLDNRDVKSLNAPRTLLVMLGNCLAGIAFIVAGAIHWPETAIMLVASAAGGYCGAQVGRRAPAHVVRVGTLILTACITLAFFARTYWGMLE
jgi:uncharacterized membrane protein YfcA